MFDAQILWKERFGLFVKETGRYLRYIFNGHLVVVFLFLLGTAGYYYQDWVKTLSPDFPAAIIMAVVLAFALAYSPILTFLSEADKIFLLPLETKLGEYFKRSIIFSLLLQSYLLLILLALFMPMHVKVTGGSFRSFFTYLIVLILLKGINLLIRWEVQRYIEPFTHTVDLVVRFCINGVVLYLLFSGANWLLLGVPVLILLLLYGFYRTQTKEKGLKWEYLIEQEEKRMGAFYRVANLFTDVPKLKDRIKRRRWLDFILNSFVYKQNHTFSHLYTRTFFRAGDYFGLFIRLTLIGGAGIYFLTHGPGQTLLALLFLYLTGFQLLPLWNHHQNKLWIDLYPVPYKSKEQSFTNLLSAILILQSLLFGLAVGGKQDWGGAALTAGAGVLFALFFVYIYSKKRRQAQ
ncbi:ABC transporter permease [Mesobacillus foraminis]|uniref:ABC transporter permease n=1 Tax=Mesobacillus foraminis TaxID=279826 RepID=UPI0039A3A99B